MMSELYGLVLVPVALVVFAIVVLLFLFEPSVAYRIAPPPCSPKDAAFLERLATLCGATPAALDALVVHSRGKDIYEAELRAIRGARTSVHVEAYIFHEGRTAARFVEALTERARAGVEVRLVLDAFGNLFTRRRLFAALVAAGGKVVWYQPLRWYTLKRYNNRTHREIVVVDAAVAFVGGAGIADWWIGDGGKPPWRDTMVRFEGALVPALQAVFAENWLAASGEILFGEEHFGARASARKHESEQESERAERARDASARGFVVASTPSEARSTRARMLFQTLIAAARQSIRIQSPYFVPDRSARRELVRASERGVMIEVLVPGAMNNHRVTRLASRSRYGELLRAGITIREYAPAMIHTKSMVVDDRLSVVGSSNWDNRSASLNDEVNLVVQDDAFAARLAFDFAKDAEESRVVTYEEWRRRGVFEKIAGVLASALARQE